jgi:hypothetical protein
MTMDEQDVQKLNPVDLVAINEGEFVGYFIGMVYDWDILDPYLMRKPDEANQPT